MREKVKPFAKGEVEKFKDWLARMGAEVISTTNPYEVVRFKAKGGTHVIYQKGTGEHTPIGLARAALDHFRNNRPFDVGIAKTKGVAHATQKNALLLRDGRNCFYCGLHMPNDDLTAEHLISKDKGGPNTLENMALAHGACNRRAANLPLAKKIQLRDQMREEMKAAA